MSAEDLEQLLSGLASLKPKRLSIAVIVVAILVVGIGTFVAGWHNFDVGECGVVFDKHNHIVEEKPLTKGWYWVNPITKDVQTFDTRIQKATLLLPAASLDSQVVTTEVTLNFRVQAQDWPYLYEDIKDMNALVETIIDPQIKETLKASTAEFKGEELIPKREAVKEQVSAKLSKSLEKSRITVTEVSMTNFEFNPEYQAAIERKQVASQDVLTAQNRKAEEQINAEIVEIKAIAEATAIKVKSDALEDNPKLVDLYIAQAWDGILPETLYISGDASGPAGVILNLEQQTASA